MLSIVLGIILFSCVTHANAYGINICPTREITLSRGQITSPNYPHKYPPNTDCTLTIKQPLDTNFQFNFTSINLGGTSDELLVWGTPPCPDDTLTISGKESRQFCGAKLDRIYTFQLNIVTLRFQSNGSVERSGFEVSFTTYKTPGLPSPVSICPSRILKPDPFGRIRSPGYPNNYDNNLDCKLTIHVPRLKVLQFEKGGHLDLYSGGSRSQSYYKFSSYADDQNTWNKKYNEVLDSCRGDGLVVAGRNDVSLLCGSTGGLTNDVVFNYETNVYLHLRTDGSGTSKGILFNYHFLDKYEKYAVRTNGQQYFARPINMFDFISRTDDNISLKFKTSKANGLFLYVNGGLGSFILLKLQNGKIVFEVNFGTGVLSVTAPSGNLNNSIWHKVVVERHGNNVNVTVDRNSSVSAQIPGSFPTHHNISKHGNVSGMMYVLGGPSGIPFIDNYIGWVRHIVINELQPISAFITRDPEYTFNGPYMSYYKLIYNSWVNCASSWLWPC